ncbi:MULTISPECIES: phosphotransferase family protein [Gordonia]|uniref:Phosphotransferase family protein n=2 Tax=Gordonia terrae TaxID=2055 RepID=A0AAD0KCB5_9ACTN|nr:MULTISPECIES: phosphotransferase family protein [Gordonia]VTR10525.1 Phosphotransferase enzyme family [Clostridioides difficile]ANY24146.1 acyl-CoA dehydrogenase [Gordonia terrae]AWO84889.1 phosphotransferase family protein [Gordonia terrae]MCG7633604.1 phosphotransferase family protein [Gordonia sp. McavH-238-E]UPW07559.1 phosphotransferase family protein [Gordonia terrae]
MATTTAESFLGELTAELDRALDAAGTLRLTDVDKRGEGNSWETYLVTVAWDGPRGPEGDTYAVKRQPVSGIAGDYDVSREVALLGAAGAIGMRVPKVVASVVPTAGARGWFAMEKVHGQIPMPPTISRMVPDPAEREQLGRDVAREMARLHAADPQTLGLTVLGPVPAPEDTGKDENDKWAQVYRDVVDIPIPILDLAFAWLDHRRDAVSGRVSLVHNDFRVGNVVIADGAITGVLDWETAHFSDPTADIAWFAQRTSRGRSPLLCKLIDLEPFLDEYETAGGWRPQPEALTWWAVQSLTKTAVGCLQAVDIYSCGERDELRYSNMAHSVYYSIGWLSKMLRDREWGY